MPGTGSAILLVLVSVASVQVGGSLAALLIPLIGVAGSVTLRLGLGAAVLLAWVRPRWRGHSRADWVTIAAYAGSLAAMNTAFYASLTRLPIGVAVTIEFLGPLLLSAALSRRPRDLVGVLIAAAGVALISRVFEADLARLDPIGVLLALVAGAAWAAYILCSGRAGARFPALDGLALAMVVAFVMVAPFGLGGAGTWVERPAVLGFGALIALMSSVVPYSCELVALRRLPAGTFGVLLSLEPAAAALAGLVVLHQRLAPIQLVGMSLVVAASAAVALRPAGGKANGPENPPPAAIG